MPGPLSAARGKAVAFVSLAVVAGLFASGCDVQENADTDRGRDLFTARCGTCHALTEARTAAVIGPSLDVAFARARANGMDQDTIEGVVEAQIENPRPISTEDPDYDNVYMPADLVEGKDAQDVAAYVASVAGVPGIEPPPLGDGMNIFVSSCGGCHQLDAAGTAGGVGPHLDEVLPGQKTEMIADSIRNPNDKISPGFNPDIMPVFDGNAIPDENLADLVKYLLDSVNGGNAKVSPEDVRIGSVSGGG